jgi:regulator of replication initiation timing
MTAAEVYAIQAQLHEIHDKQADLALEERDLRKQLYEALHPPQTLRRPPPPQPSRQQAAARPGRTRP